MLARLSSGTSERNKAEHGTGPVVSLSLPPLKGGEERENPTTAPAVPVASIAVAKPMRESMPWVTLVIDQFRAAFRDNDGKPEAWIAENIKQGMAGKPTFFAAENGIEVGTASSQRGLSLADMVVEPKPKEAKR